VSNDFDMAELDAIEESVRVNKPSAMAIPYCPQEPTAAQRIFLALTTLDALYGGAAGGGKSSALLMRALKYADRPDHNALVLRRTFSDLAQPGALMDRAAKWLASSGARWRAKEHRWELPSGSTLTFGYAENYDTIVKNYQGAEYQTICVDEATQWRANEYQYLFSRLRRGALSDIPMAARCSANPGGIGHEWVKRRYVDDPTQQRPFISAKLADNPHLDQETYLQSLEELDPITRAQLRDGVWALDAGGLVYPMGPHNFAPFPTHEMHLYEFGLVIDLGTSESKPSTAFSVFAMPFSRMSRIFYGPTKVPVHVVQSHATPGDSPNSIVATIRRIKNDFPLKWCVVDTGGLGEGYRRHFIENLGEWFEGAEKKDKLGARRIVAGMLAEGDVVLDPACQPLIDECAGLKWNLTRTDVDVSASDHLSDTLLYGARKCRALTYTPPPAKPPFDEEAALLKARERRVVQQCRQRR
jgi:hypothetical protein